MRNKNHLIVYVFCIAPCAAEAYIGPGAGISAIGSFLALVGAVLLAIVGFIWFPLKRRFFSKNRVEDESCSDSGVIEPTKNVSADDDTGGKVDRRPPPEV